MLTSEQIRAARAMLRWEQKDLAEASKISLPAIKRLETIRGPLAAQARTVEALQRALEAAGVIFVAENGDGPGVRLKKVSTSLDAQIAKAEQQAEINQEVSDTLASKKPSPARGMAALRKGLGDNDLRKLKAKKARAKGSAT